MSSFISRSRISPVPSSDWLSDQEDEKNSSEFCDFRPALVIHENNEDVIVAFISSRIPATLQESDLLIPADHPAFPATGLKITSVIKFDKIATLSKTLIEGETGEVLPGLALECNEIMSHIFRF